MVPADEHNEEHNEEQKKADFRFCSQLTSNDRFIGYRNGLSQLKGEGSRLLCTWHNGSRRPNYEYECLGRHDYEYENSGRHNYEFENYGRPDYEYENSSVIVMSMKIDLTLQASERVSITDSEKSGLGDRALWGG